MRIAMRGRWLLAAGLGIAGAVLAADEVPMTLRFTPTADVATRAPDPRPQPGSVVFSVEDARETDDATRIGAASSKDGGEAYVFRADGDLEAHVLDALAESAGAWGVEFRLDAPRRIDVRVREFRVGVTHKTMGAMYTGDVELDVVLRDASGATLWQGTTSASAERFGRRRSADNANEVLSNAMQDALAGLFENRNFRQAWNASVAAPGS